MSVAEYIIAYVWILGFGSYLVYLICKCKSPAPVNGPVTYSRGPRRSKNAEIVDDIVLFEMMDE